MIVSAVLSPGCQMYAIRSRSESSRASVSLTSPFETIFLRIRSQSMPRPSSLTVITTLLPRCDAEQRDRARSAACPPPRAPRASRGRGRPSCAPCG